jgi:hypothetical protein
MNEYLKNLALKKIANQKTIEKYKNCTPKHLRSVEYKEKYLKDIENCFFTIFLEKYRHKTQDLEKFKSRPWETCKNKFCHICAYIKSKKTFVKSYLALEAMKKDNIDFVGYHLTLTIKNPTAENLEKSFIDMNKAFKTFIQKFKELQQYLVGWQVGREVSQSDKARENNEFHPHLHCLLLLRPDFTNPTNRHNKITQLEFREKWRNACKYYNIEAFQISFKKIKSRDDFINLYNEEKETDPFLCAISEVAKYPAKPADIQKMSDYDFKILNDALYRKRMMSTGGLLKKYLNKAKNDEILHIQNYKLVETLIANYENSEFKTREINEVENSILEAMNKKNV